MEEFMSGRGKKINQIKNERAHAEWMEGKKFGRPKQAWVLTADCSVMDTPEKIAATPVFGHWEKVK